MNRRELILGLSAALVVAKVPTSLEGMTNASNASLYAFLTRVQTDLMNRIIYPPYILHENGLLEQMPTETQRLALEQVKKALIELKSTWD